jgi:translation elongation factor EF-Tu-like GTPase
VLRDAFPDPFKVPVPRLEVPLRKFTVPLGTPSAWVTVAVNVTVTPVPTDRLEEESVVVVVAGAGEVAIPLSATVCGEPVALSAIERLADNDPVVVGSNVTATAQEAPAARLVPQLLEEITNEVGLVPVMVSEVSVRVPVPEFLTVTVWAAVVDPTVVEAKDRLVGETETV